MADVGVQYLLDVPTATDITFNQYTEPFTGHDQFYITEIRGLEAPDLRVPVDPVPLGYGALVHPSWFGARHIQIEGVILIQSTTIMDSIVAIRNSMTNTLTAALQDCLAPNTGTFSFTPTGGGMISYTVNYEVGLQTTHANKYIDLQFSFGLIAGDPFA